MRARGTLPATGAKQRCLAPPTDDEVFVNFVAQHLDLPVIERQALLEADGVAERARRRVEVLEFQLEALRSSSLTTARPQ